MLKNRKWMPVVAGVTMFLTFFGPSLWEKYGPAAGRYGVKYNQERHRLGVLPLPEDWTTPSKSELKTWFPPEKQKKDSVFRSMKIVTVENDEIINELDHIVKKVKGGHEALLIYYFYDSTHHWKYMFSTPEQPHDSIISAVQADSILHTWNFNSYTIKK